MHRTEQKSGDLKREENDLKVFFVCSLCVSVSSLSFCLFACLFVYLFVYFYVALCIFISVCPSLGSLCLSVSLCLILSLFDSLFLYFLSLSLDTSLCLSMSLSVSFCLSLSCRFLNYLILFLILETIQLCAMISFFSNLTRTPMEGLARNGIKIMNLRMQNIFLYVCKNWVLNSNFL